MLGNFDKKTKALLIRALVEWADENGYINATVAEVSARLEERIGRSVSEMTTREYLKDCDFTWKQHNPIPPRNKQDRISILSRVVKLLMSEIGLGNESLRTAVDCLANKELVPNQVLNKLLDESCVND